MPRMLSAGLEADVLREFPSKSTPGKQYTVKRSNQDGVMYCDCWAWKKSDPANRTCSHLKQTIALMDNNNIDNTPDGTADQTDRMKKAIEDAVASLKGNY